MSDLTLPQLVDLYRIMRRNRSLEDRLVHLYRQGKVLGGFYRSLGQEATSVGSAYALEPGDVLGPLIRNLGSVLVMGYTPLEIVLQHLGRAASPSAGKEGNLHFGRPERGVVSSISMLGALVPVMAGVALAARLQRKRTVAMTYIGDGGTSTGAFHEGLNFAAVQKLPLVVIAENNGWAYSTPFRRQTAAKSLADRAPAYGIPGTSVDGNDVVAVYEASREAVRRARAGGGPTLVEARTYRMKGHAEHDGQAYVPRDELDDWARRDPIARHAERLLASGAVRAEDLEAIDCSISEELDRDVAEAERSPYPASGSALAGVYAGETTDSEPAFLRRLV
ncbi:MAG TPA: thiamine pyrophosphate-dependent dehydrogenase E1 component subunit alpha [Thermoanaerobaculia bacterium]|nr:thiamine pyrophosphate-dependent dehydrogenase E1 component subunit alpha [Thermoanaerobaculia bacterium]